MTSMTRPTFSDNTLQFRIPTSWPELTQEQLRITLAVMAHYSQDKAKTVLFLRLTGIKVHRKTAAGWICSVRLGWFRRKRFFLKLHEIAYFLHQLDFMDSFCGPVRLELLHGRKAVDARLHGLSFGEYLMAENLYQGFLATGEGRLMEEMAALLYRQKNGSASGRFRMSATEQMGIFVWWNGVKSLFELQFRHLFQPVAAGAQVNMLQVMDMQIRALTGGDITKETQILEQDCWRALTELDAQAAEAEEYYKKHGR